MNQNYIDKIKQTKHNTRAMNTFYIQKKLQKDDICALCLDGQNNNGFKASPLYYVCNYPQTYDFINKDAIDMKRMPLIMSAINPNCSIMTCIACTYTYVRNKKEARKSIQCLQKCEHICYGSCDNEQILACKKLCNSHKTNICINNCLEERKLRCIYRCQGTCIQYLFNFTTQQAIFHRYINNFRSQTRHLYRSGISSQLLNYKEAKPCTQEEINQSIQISQCLLEQLQFQPDSMVIKGYVQLPRRTQFTLLKSKVKIILKEDESLDNYLQMSYDNVVGLLKSPITINTYKAHTENTVGKISEVNINNAKDSGLGAITNLGYINVFEQGLRRNISLLVDQYMQADQYSMQATSNRIIIRNYVKEVDRFFGIFFYDESYKGVSKICTDAESRAFLKKLKAKDLQVQHAEQYINYI